jgi:UDP-glucose 4-epimerase
MKVLIAGGAGYIGSTIASACIDSDIEPVIADNLITGRREFVKNRTFFEGDIADKSFVASIFEANSDIGAAIMCAALISVTESIDRPMQYYENNVSKCLRFAEALIENRCTRLIFSSSASVYQTSSSLPVNENSPIQPMNPYARSKVISERMLEDMSRSGTLRVLSFRYFNPIGADPMLRSGLQAATPTHALGAMIQATRTGSSFAVTGSDYPTRDGTGIRDYVHVWDVARAHVAALKAFDSMLTEEVHYEVINLGTGRGTTVRELVRAFNEISPVPINVVSAPRRSGDSAGAYASFEKAQRLLGWAPQFSLADGIRDSLRWAEIRDTVLGE